MVTVSTQLTEAVFCLSDKYPEGEAGEVGAKARGPIMHGQEIGETEEREASLESGGPWSSRPHATLHSGSLAAA